MGKISHKSTNKFSNFRKAKMNAITYNFPFSYDPRLVINTIE